MKNFYENPEMEIILFSTEDIIATSGLSTGGAADESNGPFGGIV